MHPRFRTLPPLHTFMALGQDLYGRNQVRGNGLRTNSTTIAIESEINSATTTHRHQVDPLSVGLAEELGYHRLTLTLLKASWRRAQRLVAERRTAVVRVAEAMLLAQDERVGGGSQAEL